MAISKKAAYRENNQTKNARNNLLAITSNSPVYKNSYAGQLNDIYGQIQKGADFNYDPRNDVAFRRFADEYNALSGLAIAGNQQQAQSLTGGYGSTYAPEVSRQGLANMQNNVNNAQPYFMEMAQEAYKTDNDRLKNVYEAASNARNDELNEYVKKSAAYNEQSKFAQQLFSDERNFDYSKYSDNRDYVAQQFENEQQQSNFEKEYSQKEYQYQRDFSFREKQNKQDYQLKSWDTYNKIASKKCAEYNENKNNSGMKAYLDGLVKAGKITQYMADNLYSQYKYTAPASSGGSSSGGGSSGGSSSGGSGDLNDNITDDITTGKVTVVNNFGEVIGIYDSGCSSSYTVKTGMLQNVGMNRTNTGRANAIDKLDVDDDLKIWLASYFKL